MALNDKELVKFGFGYGESSKTAGMISFDPSSKAIYVGDGAEAKLVTSSVKDATFAGNILKVTKVDGSEFSLNFTDVASAKETMAVFTKLETAIEANATGVSTNAAAIEALDAAFAKADASVRADFAAADASLKDAYEAADKAINDKIGEVAEGKTVVEMIEAAAEAAAAAHSVVAKDSELLTLSTSTGENGAVTYTLGTTNVAKADDLDDVSTRLADVKSTADAAATDASFQAYKTSNDAAVQANATAIGEVSTRLNTHATNTELHVTKTLQDRWNAAADEIEAFMDAENIGDKVVDTLKEIQDYIASDASAADTMTKNIAAAQATADQAVADASAAQADVDALEGVVSTLTTTVSDNHTAALAAATSAKSEAIADASTDAATKAAAAEAAAKKYADDTFQVKGNYETAGAAAAAEAAAKSYVDAKTVNGKTLKDAVVLSGVDILVGGTGTNKVSTVSTAIEDLYGKVAEAEAAGVQSVAVAAADAAYAEFDKSAGAVVLSIKTQDVSTATTEATGLVDAYEAKSYVSFAITGAKSDLVGTANDASTADTIYGAKKAAAELNDAMDTRMQVVEGQLQWTLLA